MGKKERKKKILFTQSGRSSERLQKSLTFPESEENSPLLRVPFAILLGKESLPFKLFPGRREGGRKEHVKTF